ncbi:unnamed protein product [Rhodiola kirilowii]
MSGVARVSSGITGGLKKTIQDIREIAGEHSDEDIHAMLKECSMDPNEAAQRLLHLDTFHEVKKKHGRRKETVIIKPFDNPGRNHGARVGRGAKVGRGNFYSHSASQNNVTRSLGGSNENGHANMSKGHKSENTNVPQSTRSVHVKVDGKSIQSGTSQENMGIISYAGHDASHDILTSDENCVPADADKLLVLKLTPASISAMPEKTLSNGNHVDSGASAVHLQHLSSMSTETVLSLINSVHEDQNVIPNGGATCSNDKIQIGGPISYMTETVNNAKSQLTEFNEKNLPGKASCAAKDVAFKEMDDCMDQQSVSEENITVLNEEMSNLNVSDGHVVFPEHLQVPEAYKAMLTFGSFDSSWVLDGKQTADGNAMNTDMLADHSCLVKTVSESSIESNGITVECAQEKDPSYLQSMPPMSNSTPPLFGHTSSDVVINIDMPETESLLRNGGLDLANHSSNYIFGYPPQAQLQVHDGAEPQGGNFVASSMPSIDQNSIVQPSGATHDIVSSPSPAPFLGQTYHQNFFPYGHYYPQFFVPQVHQSLQYLTHGGFPQQPSVANIYFASAAAGIKYPHQQQKQGSNAGTNGYIGVPSGYSPYVPYAFPYGLPPVVIPENVTGDDDRARQIKEDTIRTTEHQTETSGEWMAGTGRTLSGLQMNPFYNGLSPGQGHPWLSHPHQLDMYHFITL